MENLDSVVAWLSGGAGAVIVASWAASWLLEDWAAWQTLGDKAKRMIILLIALVLGIGGTILQQYPDAVVFLKPYLDTVILVIGAWLGTQVAHKFDK